MVDEETARIIQEGLEKPLPKDRQKKLLVTIVETMKKSAVQRGDSETAENLDGDPQVIAQEIMDGENDD